jgi:hypothetical protein
VRIAQWFHRRDAFEAAPKGAMQFRKRLRIESSEGTMNKLLCGLLAAAALAPLGAYAQQSNQPVTRAEVRADLVQLEAAGYRPSTHDGDYPQALMKAEARVAAANARNAAYGGEADGMQAHGARAE